MQPVNDSRLQLQTMPVRQRSSEHKEAAEPGVTTRRGDTFVLPEDVVNLSSDRTTIPDSSVNKKPSVSVSAVERKALRDSFSVYA